MPQHQTPKIKKNIPQTLESVTLKIFDKNLIHVPADIKSWIAFYIQRRHAATILYTTYDKQLILIYALPSLSHTKLQLHYGQWQVKYSKPDWIWQQPETQMVKSFLPKWTISDVWELAPSPQNNSCLDRATHHTVGESYSIYWGRCLYQRGYRCWCDSLLLCKCWEIKSDHAETYCSVKGNLMPNTRLTNGDLKRS